MKLPLTNDDFLGSIVAKIGWVELFNRCVLKCRNEGSSMENQDSSLESHGDFGATSYDTDGSGEIYLEEFSVVVRGDIGVKSRLGLIAQKAFGA